MDHQEILTVIMHLMEGLPASTNQALKSHEIGIGDDADAWLEWVIRLLNPASLIEAEMASRELFIERLIQ